MTMFTSFRAIWRRVAGCQGGPDARRVTHEDGDDNNNTLTRAGTGRVDREVGAAASLPYTMTTVCFGFGGILMGRLSDRFGIFVPVSAGALCLGLGPVERAEPRHRRRLAAATRDAGRAHARSSASNPMTRPMAPARG
jgi:hypothetical protein